MSIWTNWDPLEEVIVGRSYSPGQLDWALDPAIKDNFNILLKETEEDLDNLAKCLINLGVTVYRPTVTPYTKPMHFPAFTMPIPVAPIVPRDQYLVYGETIYQTYTSMPDRYLDSINYYNIFKDLFDRGHNWISLPPPSLKTLDEIELLGAYNNWSDAGGLVYTDALKDRLLWHTATMFKCGDAIITNTRGPGTQLGLEWMRRNLPADTRIIDNVGTELENWGHIDHGFFMTDDDTVFCQTIDYVPECLRSKRIIEVGFQPEHTVLAHIETKYKKALSNGQYSPEWVDEWLGQWKGYLQKVNFDTNVLVVDSKNVIFTNDVPKKLFELLEQEGIKIHVCTQRHTVFWCGGVHCLTLDLKRRGKRRSII